MSEINHHYPRWGNLVIRTHSSNQTPTQATAACGAFFIAFYAISTIGRIAYEPVDRLRVHTNWTHRVVRVSPMLFKLD
jgi:hypothetical protein